jgi:phosphoglycolate phosphatase
MHDALPPTFDLDAVLFDLDGTLIDTLPDIAAASNQMLADLGQPPRTMAEVNSFVGKGVTHLVSSLLTEGRDADPALAEQGLELFNRHYAETNGRKACLYEGVEATLTALRAKGLHLGCITNKPTAFTEPLLRQTGLGAFFECVLSGDTLPAQKPHPEPLLHACRLFGVEPARTLMVGDSINDAQAARAAGIPVLLLTYGYSGTDPVETIPCDGLLDAFPELLARIR